MAYATHKTLKHKNRIQKGSQYGDYLFEKKQQHSSNAGMIFWYQPQKRNLKKVTSTVGTFLSHNINNYPMTAGTIEISGMQDVLL